MLILASNTEGHRILHPITFLQQILRHRLAQFHQLLLPLSCHHRQHLRRSDTDHIAFYLLFRLSCFLRDSCCISFFSSCVFRPYGSLNTSLTNRHILLPPVPMQCILLRSGCFSDMSQPADCYPVPIRWRCLPVYRSQIPGYLPSPADILWSA